jgi:hypothetical protein
LLRKPAPVTLKLIPHFDLAFRASFSLNQFTVVGAASASIVHALHQEVTDVGMPQPVKRNWCYLGISNKPTKRFSQRVSVHRLSIGASEH